MSDFMELTEEELLQYSENLCKENKDLKLQIAEHISNITDSLSKNLKKVEHLKEDVKENPERLFDNISAVSRSISHNSDQLIQILKDFGINKPEETEHGAGVYDRAQVDFKYFDHTMIINLPELLPHRPAYDAVRRQMRYYYDADRWKNAYNEAFRKEFEHGKFKIFDQKVVMIFFHHFDRNRRVVPDTDNLETKPIIDIISLYVLRDDSHEYMSHYVDAIEDDRDYTEIIICPQNQILNYIG